MLTDADLAARTRTVVAAAVRAAGRHGLTPQSSGVLHDLFSVVVGLAPEPVVARVPTVLPSGLDAAAQRDQRRREVEVCRRLADAGPPVVLPAPSVPDQPVAADGFSLTFWTRLETVAGVEPDPGATGAGIATLHAALRTCPVGLNWMQPVDDTVPAMLDALRDGTRDVSPDDREPCGSGRRSPRWSAAGTESPRDSRPRRSSRSTATHRPTTSCRPRTACGTATSNASCTDPRRSGGST